MAKKLLEEATVRRFMKIAGIQTLSENFVDKLEEENEEQLEEMYNEEEPGMEPSPEAEEMPAAEPEMAQPEAEVPEMDEVEMEEDDKVELLKKLAQALGVDVEVEEDEEMPEEAGEEMPEEAGEEMPEEAGEEMMEEGEHMEEPAKDPAGHSLESLPMVDDADSKDPNQDPKEKEQDPTKAQGAQHMAESKEEFKKRLIEQVAKRVAARLKELK